MYVLKLKSQAPFVLALDVLNDHHGTNLISRSSRSGAALEVGTSQGQPPCRLCPHQQSQGADHNRQVWGPLTRSIDSPRQGERPTKSGSMQGVPSGAGGKGPDTRLKMRPPATSGQDPARKRGRGRAEDLRTYSTAQAQTKPGAQAGSKMDALGPQAKGAR